ncbi:MAG: hypothetical protein EA385_15205 [Salinarimonadaceae bacterium]|nr:MAG: hypothetical protein EA385_15205 [Salinarimonadaceae bacterium]
MLIMFLDLAVQTGYAYGRPGEKPKAGVVRVKKPSDPLHIAPWNLETFLQDINAFGLPDLIAYEAPIPLNAAMSDGRPRSAEALLIPIKLEQAVERYCLPRQIRWERLYPATIRKHFLGKANFGQRDETKRAVLDRCRLLGYIDRDRVVRNKSSDPLFDEADALAGWDCASAKYARARPAELMLFGERAG